MIYTLTWYTAEKIAGLEAIAHKCLSKPSPLTGAYASVEDLVALKRAAKDLLENSILAAINDEGDQ